MSYCGEQTAVKREPDGLVAVSLSCRAWTCPNCTDQRQRQLIAEVVGGNPRTFLTLTTRRQPGKSANRAALEISRGWRLLRLRIMRKYRLKSLPFFAVMEAHKSGWPHLHICLRMRYVPWKWLVTNWKKITGSRGVRIERIQALERVAKYVAPYCAKAVIRFGSAKRYWQSRDYDQRSARPAKPVYAPGDGWEIWMKPLQTYLDLHIELGHTVVSQSSRVAFIWVDTS